MSEATSKPITARVYKRHSAYRRSNVIPFPRPRPKPPAPASAPASAPTRGNWFEVPLPRRKITEAEAHAAWDALPDTVTVPLPQEIHEPVLVPFGDYARSRMPLRIIRREDYPVPPRPNDGPRRMLEVDEHWVTIWPAGTLRFGAVRPWSSAPAASGARSSGAFRPG